jgi:hypothetical protein
MMRVRWVYTTVVYLEDFVVFYGYPTRGSWTSSS